MLKTNKINFKKIFKTQNVDNKKFNTKVGFKLF